MKKLRRFTVHFAHPENENGEFGFLSSAPRQEVAEEEPPELPLDEANNEEKLKRMTFNEWLGTIQVVGKNAGGAAAFGGNKNCETRLEASLGHIYKNLSTGSESSERWAD